MLMEKTINIGLKGIIPCPACGKEFVFAYEDAKGHASVPCIRCERILMIDYEHMKASVIPPKRRRNVS